MTNSMKKKVTKADRDYLRTICKNKGWELGIHLLAYGVRGEDFEYIMQGSADVKYDSPKQRQQWLAEAIERMDERLPPERVKEIREGSACCLGGEREKLTTAIREGYPTVEERFEAFKKARLIIGDTAEKVGEDTYRVCFWETPPAGGCCSCLKYVPKDKPMSKSWCACCGGHIKTHFENALGVRAECECISSQLSSCGREPCAFLLRVVET